MKQEWLLVLLLALVTGLSGCGGGNRAAVTGRLVNAKGNPVPGVKIAAVPAQPGKDEAAVETVTSADGGFRLEGLTPSTAYVLSPRSDRWTCAAKVKVTSGRQGETTVLPEPLVIDRAYAKNGGGLVVDLATGATRFVVAGEVISDSVTGLDWMAGPDQDVDYVQARQWVAARAAEGANWRLPKREELKNLYQQGIGERNLDPSFRFTGWYVWAEVRDASSAWYFDFINGKSAWFDRAGSLDCRVFAVRQRPRG